MLQKVLPHHPINFVSNKSMKICILYLCYLHIKGFQDLPFEKLVEALYTTSLFYRERSISTHPLFNVMFVLHNRNINKQLELNQVQYQNIQIHNGTAKYDLLLQLAETSEGLVGHFEYRTDLFKVNTIKRMVEHLKILLTEIVANPKESISRLSILSPLEKNQLLIQWNKSDLGISIYELFTLISNRVIRKYV